MQLNRVNRIDDFVKIENVLASTADKNGIELFVNGIIAINPDVNIYSTAGPTARYVRSSVKDIKKPY